MSTVLHFFTLPELADELEPGAVVRVESSVRTVNSRTTNLAMRIADVHARAINGGEVLVFMLHAGRIQTINGEPTNEEEADRLEARMVEAEIAIRVYLQARGLQVRPGLIDIGGAEPVQGTWAGLKGGDDGHE